MDFLSDIQFSPLVDSGIQGSASMRLASGQGQGSLEVIALESVTPPIVPDIVDVWRKSSHDNVPLLLVDVYGHHAAVCGPFGDDPPVLTMESRQAEKLCRTALEQPDRDSALRYIRTALKAMDSPVEGVRNEGLLASHEIGVWLETRKDSTQAKAKSVESLPRTGLEMVKSLGFEVSPLPEPASVLVTGEQNIAVAVFLDRGESTDKPSHRFLNSSPITYALTKADQNNLPYVIIADGPALRIYPTSPGVGVGRRGRTETFIELHLNLLSEEHIPLLWYLFSADALGNDGTFEELLVASKEYATRLGERLRERVYRDVIPGLAKGLVAAQDLDCPTKQELDFTYHMALTLLFRILFIAYGEDKDLLPYQTNNRYRVRSFKQKARDMLRTREEGLNFNTDSFDHWDDAVRLFEAVNSGSRELGVPEYNGGFFSQNANLSPTGERLAGLRLSDHVFGPILEHLLVDDSSDGIGLVDFRSLGVGEFGTIYEGLLESELSLATMDLIVDPEGGYRPANGADPQVLAGDVYIHNKSGSRKASGSYFTKDFCVKYILDHSLEPALDEHIANLENLNEVDAGKSFFDFRIADISMGSGYFLVAAVDRMERRLQRYLSERPLPVVADELVRLRDSAISALGTFGEGVEIEDTTLLRRQIARRCIYGVDINLIAVELARVSLWIHTFVPGLPLSVLDHHIVEGNSLVGIATLDEARELVSAAMGGPLFNGLVDSLVCAAAEDMVIVGDLADSDAAEILAARGALAEARLKIDPLKAMFDVLAASRLDTRVAGHIVSIVAGWQDNLTEIRESDLYTSVREVMAGTKPFHFPVEFPDVFARKQAGFDVVLGNPPWEKVGVEEHEFWARHFPGFRGVSQRERELRIDNLRADRPDLASKFREEVESNRLLRNMLMRGPFPGMGSGHPDLYKAFCWRFWNLLGANGGRLGVVLPRSVWSVKGSELFRKEVLSQGQVESLVFLVNNRHWIFDNVHPQYTVALTNLIKRSPKGKSIVPTRGPYPSMISFAQGVEDPPADLTTEEILAWTNVALIPLLTSKGAKITGEVFRSIRRHPSLGDTVAGNWKVRPHQELMATSDKNLMTFAVEGPEGCWPIYTGESFDIWSPDNGSKKYYAWGKPNKVLSHLYMKRLKSARRKGSPFSEFQDTWLEDEDTLPCLRPRVVFRDVSRATDSRTVRVALVPPKVFLTHKAPYLLHPVGCETDEAFIIGVLSSIILDWYSRRLVETSLTFFLFNDLPIPRPRKDDPLLHRVIALSGRLASPDERFSDWAKAVGVEYGPIEPAVKDDMIAELDALIAHLYGLTEQQVSHIFSTFHSGWDYKYRLLNTLEHYNRLQSKF